LTGVFAAGCASSTMAARNRVGVDATGVPGTTVISAADLSRYASRGTLRQALEALNPAVLAGRGGVLRVSIDGGSPGDTAVLSSIPAADVAEVKLVRASSSARAQNGILPNGDVVSGDLLVV